MTGLKPAAFTSPNSFALSGTWAGQQLARYSSEHGFSPQVLRPCMDAGPSELRANALLTRDSWEDFDRRALEEAQQRLVVYNRLVSAGLTREITNAMGRTVITWQKIDDMNPAEFSMHPEARTTNERLEYTEVSLPNPITHKDFDLDIRSIRAHQDRGEPLDDTHVRDAGRVVGEALENLVLFGGASAATTFGGNTLYGLTTHPDRNTLGFGGSEAWDAGTKTGEEIVTDVLSMIEAARADRHYGPFLLIVAGNYSTDLQEDFKANSDLTIEQRVRQINGIQDLVYADFLSDAVLLVQLSSSVVQIADGEGIQTVQWESPSGFTSMFKVMAIQVPIVKSTAALRSGIVHMS